MDLGLLMNLKGFSDDGETTALYSCHKRLEEAFWDEFWQNTKTDEAKRRDIRHLADVAGKLDVLMQYGFQHERDGRMTDRLTMFNDSMLKELFKDTKGQEQ